MNLVKIAPTQWINVGDGPVVSVFWDVQNVAVEIEVGDDSKYFAAEMVLTDPSSKEQQEAAVGLVAQRLQQSEYGTIAHTPVTVMPQSIDPHETVTARCRRLVSTWRDQSGGTNGIAAQTLAACADALERTLRGAG